MDDVERRLARLEAGHTDLEVSLAKLNISLALLNQTLQMMEKNEEKRQSIRDKGFMFVVGTLISAVIAWVIKGGLTG